MERRWVAKNVDLGLLANSIVDFLKTLDFEIISGETVSEHAIFAGDSPNFPIDDHISVTIQGKPEDFVVKMELNDGKKKRSLFVSPLLMSLIGAGFLLSKRFRSEEAWLKLEREFWRHLENIVVQLTDSSNPMADQ
ncbi:MAG: hypothetical protein OEZ21_05190 [Candidatus Bathyarchaeota archaeon]|nr:hypothetical protein [Candidatus Bathyarchaeota archaeon]MDH5746335.1 hypothetical protein [Candidatus Bathyarchaeota archaeon]